MVGARKSDHGRYRLARRALAAAAAGAALTAAGAAQAAMNFCAAPGLQSSESTSDKPEVQALTRRIDAHLNDLPRASAQLPEQGAGAGDDPALDDMELMRDAALAWRVTNRAAYLNFVDRYLRAWVTTYQPRFAALDASRFAGLILAYDMTASVLTIETRNATASFIARLGNDYIRQAAAQPRPLGADWRGPAQSRRVELVALAAYTLGDRGMMKTAQDLYFEQLANSVAADGRVDASDPHTAIATLEPLVTAALSARRFNRNLPRQRSAAGGASLFAALDWFAPYASGARSPAGWNAAAAAPQDAAALYYLAARLDGRYTRIADTLAPQPPAWLAACLPLAAPSPLHFPQ